ncbi:adenylate kinase isoenzyme 5-like [Vipera latastei]
MSDSAEAGDYISSREIPRLFESMLTGLMYYQPEDPISYLEGCLKKVRAMGGPEKLQWDTFLSQEDAQSTAGGLNKKALFHSASPSAPFSSYHRDVSCVQSQFSIESDSGMTESTGLIQEYDVFDPERPRPKMVFVIGGPGSGKGTQSRRLATHFGFVGVSVGEILRAQMLRRVTSDKKWELIAKIIADGELAPSETTVEELKQQFIRHPEAKGFVVDGFPRDIGQAFLFEEQMATLQLNVSSGAAQGECKAAFILNANSSFVLTIHSDEGCRLLVIHGPRSYVMPSSHHNSTATNLPFSGEQLLMWAQGNVRRRLFLCGVRRPSTDSLPKPSAKEDCILAQNFNAESYLEVEVLSHKVETCLDSHKASGNVAHILWLQQSPSDERMQTVELNIKTVCKDGVGSKKQSCPWLCG